MKVTLLLLAYLMPLLLTAGGLRWLSRYLDAERARRRQQLAEELRQIELRQAELFQNVLDYMAQQRASGEAAERRAPGWAQLLQLTLPTTREAVTQAYHRLSRLHHPDTSGSDGTVQQQLNAARDQALKYLGLHN